MHRFILMTDISGSSRLAEAHPQHYLEVLEQHNRLVEQTVTEHGGQTYKHLGDGYLVLFETATACMDCAVALRCSLSEIGPVADDQQLEVRMALHGGELRPSDAEYYGPALNRASRICQVCNPGQVLCSATVSTAAGKPGDGMLLHDLGSHHLRDLDEPEQLLHIDHPDFAAHEFPPLTTLENRPNNLLRQPNHFIGRERELDELAGLTLDNAYLLSIVAPGGYGKSRLAAQLCANLLHRFENGAFMVYLAPVREHSAVATTIANALGYQFYGSREPEDQLCDYLRNKELLLCLDNFEHVMDCAPLVRKFLDSAPKLKIITTSREPLRIRGERIYVLEPLPVRAPEYEYTEAEMLFSDRAQLVKHDFSMHADNHPLVRQICTKLSGIPLAIELAAAWMDSFTLTELNDELAGQLELESRQSDTEPRHQSLKASLDWSWNLLGEEQQAVLMKLSTFRGGFFHDAAGAALEMKGIALRATLAKLADKSWLYTREVNGQTRFFLRDLLALEYAFGRLQAHDSFESAAMAHAAHFSVLMEREGRRLCGDGTPTGQSEALGVIRLEQQNIHAALETLLEHITHEDAEDAAILLLPIARNLRSYLAMTSAGRELVDRYSSIRQAVERTEVMQEVRLQALLGCSWGFLKLNDYDAVRSTNKQVRRIAEDLGDRQSIAAAQVNLGVMENLRGNYDTAHELLTDSLAGLREIGDRYGIAWSLNNLGLVAYYLSNFDPARELFAESLAIKREIGDRYGTGASLNNLGLVEVSQGDFNAAHELFTESLAIQREIDDCFGTGASLNNLGLVAYNLGNFDNARELFTQSLAILKEIGDRSSSALLLNNLGDVEYRNGSYDASRELFTESLAIRREIGDLQGIAHTQTGMGVLELRQGNHEPARTFFTESLAIRREIGDRSGIAQTQTSLGVLEFRQGNHDAARVLITESLVIRREIGDQAGICESLVACTCLLAGCARLAEAAVCMYGVLHQSRRLDYHFDPIAGELLEWATEMIEHPETGPAAAKRGKLEAEAESMSLDELADFALDEMEKLQPEQQS